MSQRPRHPARRLYQIQNPDGSFRGEGPYGRSSGPKFWRTPSHVKNHLKLASGHRDSAAEIVDNAGAKGAVVVEYDLVEVARTPVEDFLDG
jgi:hypothetical protein